jgi:putative antitoxin of VapBC-like toxin-antitoxin system
MATIDIDFEVYKELTMRRQSESDSCNDVIRRLLKLNRAPHPNVSGVVSGAIFKGIMFPDGTQFRVNYKGQTHTAEIKKGVWVDAKGITRASPSEAAHAITGTNVNGWRFWHCRRPNDAGWQIMDRLRSEPAESV